MAAKDYKKKGDGMSMPMTRLGELMKQGGHDHKSYDDYEGASKTMGFDVAARIACEEGPKKPK